MKTPHSMIMKIVFNSHTEHELMNQLEEKIMDAISIFHKEHKKIWQINIKKNVDHDTEITKQLGGTK